MKVNRNNDVLRLDILESYGLLDSPQEKLYDDITSLAASICNAEICVITLVSETKELYPSHYGINSTKALLETSFFQYMITNNTRELIVEDTTKDQRFFEDAWVISHPNINFFAGVLLISPTNIPFGILSVMDSKPKKFNSHQSKALHTLAQQIIQLFELRKTTVRFEKTKAELKSKEELLNSIIESTKIGVWKWEKISDFIQLNAEGAKIIGEYTKGAKKLTMEDWKSRIHPQDLEQTLNKLDTCFANKNEVYTLSYRIFDQQKNILWIKETGKVLKWSQNLQPLIVQGTFFNITEEVDRTAELELAKKNQESLINGTKDLLWSVDTQYNFIIANKAFEQMIKANLGRTLYPGESALHKEFNKENLIKWKSYYDRALSGEQFSIREKLEDPSNPETAYGLISLSPIYDNGNELLGVSCFSKDITTEVLLQQDTQRAKEETDKIINASLDIICTVDRNGCFLTISKACYSIWGYSPKELIGKKYTDFICPDDINASLDAEKKVVQGEKLPFFENRYLHKTNYLVPMLWSANWDEDEEIMYCVGRNNAEIKRAAEQLSQSEHRFKTLVQEGTELIAIFDQEANFTYVSPTSNRTLKMTPEILVGTNAFDHIHPDDHEEVYAQFLETLKKPQVYIRPFRFKNGNGEWTWLETIATNKTDEPTINGIVVNTRDVTDRLLHLKAIKEQNKALREISWNQSHVVRAPVARLLGLITLIKKDGVDVKEKEKIINFIISSAEEIDSIIKKNVEQTTSITDL